MSTEEHEQVIIAWGCATKLPVEAVDLVAFAAKSSPTWEVYHTQGGVRKGSVGERPEVLVEQRFRWFIMPKHEQTLKSIAKRFKVEYADLLTVDGCIRIKRAKGTTIVDGKVLFYVCSTASKEGDHAASWLDITLTSEPSSKSMWTSPTEIKEEKQRHAQISKGLEIGRVPRECSNCSKIDEKQNKHRQCSRCHKAAYCSVECQRVHWAQHKRSCIAK
jgi:hypothetical protein